MLITAIALAGAGFIGGCQAPADPHPVSLIAPWSGTYSVPVRSNPALLAESPGAFQMLGDQQYFFDRPEKFAWGSTPVSQVSAYTDYQYDVQAIGLPGANGYRYRFVVRSGISVP